MSNPPTCPHGHELIGDGERSTPECPDCASSATIIEKLEPTSQRSPAVPGYEILGRLGQGGMGVVYKARQTRLNRVVALKMVVNGPDAGPDLLSRFRTEAEAAAQLRHPHIVAIYEVGDHAIGPYISLEYVEGGSLEKHLRGVPQPPEAAARFVEIAARAMHHAHEHGVVHRDLKPANILLQIENGRLGSPIGSTLRYAIPKITDFGLAKLLSGPSHQTKTGDVLGTPSYMAPEQAGGVTKQITAAVDVYALGAILYEMLTGRPPFLAASPVETVLQVLTVDPVSLRRLQPQVPKDLETIALRCLEKSPRKRYQTAEALADDLQRFQLNEPIVARPIGKLERLEKWARRRPALAGLIVVVFLSLIGGIVFALWHASRLQQEVVAKEFQRRRAEEEAVAKEFQRNRAESHLVAVQKGISELTRTSQEYLGPMPATRQAQRAILESALKIYHDLLEKEPGNPGMRHVQANATWELAKLFLALERVDESLKASERALALLDGLLTEDAKNPAYSHDVAKVKITLGNIHRARKRNDQADAAYNEARLALNQLLAEHPDDAGYRNQLAIVCHDLGNLYVAAQRFKDAEAAYQQSIQIRQQLVKDIPGDATVRRELAVTLTMLGRCYHESGQIKRSITPLRDALAQLRELPPEVMNIPSCRLEWARTWMNLGKAYHSANDVAQAEEAYKQAIRRYEALVADYPEAPDYRNELAGIFRRFATLLIHANRIDEASKQFRRSCELFERLLSENPKSKALQFELSTSLRYLGDLLNDQTQTPDAAATLQRAVDLARPLVESNADSAEYQTTLGSALCGLGVSQRAGKKLSEARKSFEEGVAHQRRARQIDSTNRLYRYEHAFTSSALAGVLLDLGLHREAVSAAEEYLEASARTKDDLCRASAYFGRAGELAAKDVSLPPGERKTLSEPHYGQAVKLLREAISLGLGDPAELDAYGFPTSLKERADFKELFNKPLTSRGRIPCFMQGTKDTTLRFPLRPWC